MAKRLPTWAWIAIFGGSVIAIVVFLPLFPILFLGVSAALTHGTVAATPDTYQEVTISISEGDREWTHAETIACVPIVDGIAIVIYRSRVEFPNFTVIPLSEGRVLIVPLGNACVFRHTNQTQPYVSDSATAPTWVEESNRLGVVANVQAVPARGSVSESREAVRALVRRIRDETRWGGAMAEVNGQLTEVEGRITGREFDRITRSEIVRTDGRRATIPPGALRSGCVESQYHIVTGNTEEARTTRDFQHCVLSEWAPIEDPQVFPEATGYCQQFRVVGRCMATDDSSCSPNELRFRPSPDVRGEFAHSLAREDSMERYVCHGVIRTTDGLSVRRLESSGLGVTLTPYQLMQRRDRLEVYFQP